MRYYIIAGEASGDLHGSNLIRQLHQIDRDAVIRCWGGDRMEAAGATLVKHYRELSFMGFVEVVGHLGTIFKNLSFCKQDIADFRPDAVVLIDYPGFNLRIAGWAHAHQLKVVYYISPQIWAWKENRVHTIRRIVDKMIVILPFEEAFYQKWDYQVTYVGHPLADVIEAARQAGPGKHIAAGKIIALLPGSRKQEIQKKLPIMLTMVERFPEYTFVIARAPHQSDSVYDEIVARFPSDRIISVHDATYDLLLQADAALVTSGTATLETALFNVPQVVCYTANPLSYALAKRLVKVKYISLVNLILDKEAVPELIQYELNGPRLQRELSAILSGEKRARQLADYKVLQEKLREGNASKKAAAAIVDFLHQAPDQQASSVS